MDQLQEMNNGHTDESLAQLYEELCQTHDKQAMLFRKYSKETLDLLQSLIKAKYGADLLQFDPRLNDSSIGHLREYLELL